MDNRILKNLSIRLDKAEILWNTALVGTLDAARYERLLNDIVQFIRHHKNSESLLTWLRAQPGEYAQEILATVDNYSQWEEYEKERLDSRRIYHEHSWNSYTLTREFKRPEPDASELEKREWVDQFIQKAWNAAPGYRVITDFKKHEEAFAWLRAWHTFPDLIEVIGPPLKAHHVDGGGLSLQRKRELLLLGLFTWRGFTITYSRWYAFAHPDYFWVRSDKKKSWKWLIAVACPYPPVAMDEADALLRPPDAFVWETLNSVAPKWGITPSAKRETGVRRLPRRVLCTYCGRSFVSSDTRRVHYKGRLTRLCNEHADLLQKINVLQKGRGFKR